MTGDQTRETRAGFDVVAIAPNAWREQWMNRQHLTRALARMVPALYVQEPHMWPLGLRPRDEKVFVPSVEHQGTVSVLRIPKVLARRTATGRWNRATFDLKSRIVRRHLSAERPTVLYLWHPELWDYARFLRPALTVYHMYDFDPDYREGEWLAPEFLRACREADLVITGTRLQAQYVPHRNVTVVPNGVAWDWFAGECAEPADIAGIGRPRIGYIGTISEKLDFRWISELARQPDWQVVLAGPLRLTSRARGEFSKVCAAPNVHYLGEKPAESVPAYMLALDIGLMNYRPGTHMDVASPLKLYEYCAAGLPIVAAELPALRDDPDAWNFTTFAKDPDDACGAVAQLLMLPYAAERRRISRAFAARNSWAERARTIVDVVTDQLAQRGYLS